MQMSIETLSDQNPSRGAGRQTRNSSSPHRSPITAVAAASKQGLVATGGYDGRVVLWNQDRQVLWSHPLPDLVNHVAFDPTGCRLAAADADGWAYVFRVEDGSLLRRCGPHGDDVNALDWHPTRPLLASVMDATDRRIHFWNIQTGGLEATLSGHEHGIFSIGFDQVGRRLATAAEDGTVRIWDTEAFRQLLVLEHPGDPETVAWSADGRCVVSGCDDGILRVWDSNTGEALAKSSAATGAVRFAQFSSDGKQLLAGSYDGTIRVYQFPELEVCRELRAPFQWERSAAFFGRSILVGSFGGRPVLHTPEGLDSSEPELTLGINAMSTGPRDRLIVGRDDGAVVDVLGGRVLVEHDSIVNAVAASGDGSILASADYRGELRLYSLTRHEEIARVRLDSGPINAIAWRTDGPGLMTAGYDGHIRWWTNTLELRHDVAAHKGPVKSLAWCPITRTIVAGSSDDSASIWRDGERVAHIAMPGLVLVNSVACSGVLPHFATASRDLIVRIWNTETGRLVEQLPQGHTKSVKSIAYSRDGENLVTGAYDGNAILWRKSAHGWTFKNLQLHGKPGVPAVGFHGGAVVTAGWDGSVGRWNLDGTLLARYDVASIRRSGS
jgi:WD40 repeat protein